MSGSGGGIQFLQSRSAAAHGGDGIARMRQLGAQDALVCDVVITNENSPAGIDGAALFRRNRFYRLEGHREVEARSKAHFAGYTDLSIHQINQPAHDGQSQARAAEMPGRGGVRLHEWLE